MLRNIPLSRLEITQIVLIGLGIVLLLVGANLVAPLIIDLGLLFTAAGTLSSGFNILISQRVSFLSYISRDLYGNGVRAIMSGVLLIVIGIWIWTLALIRIMGLQKQAGSYLASHPGVILLNVALLLILLAAFVLLRLEGWRASFENVLRAVPLLLGGGFLLGIAFALLIVGLYALISPAASSAWLNELLSPFYVGP
jgi:hypothetical protein